MKWISVKERLPDTNELVLCYEDGHMFLNSLEIYKEKLIWCDIDGDEYIPTHWYPLPKLEFSEKPE